MQRARVVEVNGDCGAVEEAEKPRERVLQDKDLKRLSGGKEGAFQQRHCPCLSRPCLSLCPSGGNASSRARDCFASLAMTAKTPVIASEAKQSHARQRPGIRNIPRPRRRGHPPEGGTKTAPALCTPQDGSQTLKGNVK